MICNECETVSHCLKNGCVPKQQALDRMAENARELGLDYESAPSQYGSPELQEMIVARALEKDRAAQPAVPLTNTEFCEQWFKQTGRIMGTDKQLLLQAKRVTEAAHGITKGQP